MLMGPGIAVIQIFIYYLFVCLFLTVFHLKQNGPKIDNIVNIVIFNNIAQYSNIYCYSNYIS